MQKKPEVFNLNRREFVRNTAISGAGLALAPSLLMTPFKAGAASLDDVHEAAAAKAKELATGKSVKLVILQPSGSLGNVKPVADVFTEKTGIAVEYLEVPLGEV